MLKTQIEKDLKKLPIKKQGKVIFVFGRFRELRGQYPNAKAENLINIAKRDWDSKNGN